MKIIIDSIFKMSMTASVVIAAVLLVRLFLRRCPKIYSYLLWSIAGIRLCIPVSFESRISIFNLFTKADTRISALPVEGTPIGDTAAAPAADPYKIIGIVWLCGVVVLTVYSIFTYYRLQHRLKVSFPMGDSVYGVEGLSSPFVMGFMSPRIYIPLGLDPATESYVLMHERTHLKRGDHLIKLFAFALLCIHWFNPLCWLAFIFMSRDMEMSCDEKVLGTGDISRDYSSALLSFAANKRFPSPGPLCFGEVSVKRRIKNILSWKKPALWISVLCGLVCITVFVVCTGNASKKEQILPVESDIEMFEEKLPNTSAQASLDTSLTETTEDTEAVDTVETPPAVTSESEETKVTEKTKQSIDTAPVYNYLPKDTEPAATLPIETSVPVTEQLPTDTEHNNYFEEGGALVDGIMGIWENMNGDDTEWWEYPNIQEIVN